MLPKKISSLLLAIASLTVIHGAFLNERILQSKPSNLSSPINLTALINKTGPQTITIQINSGQYSTNISTSNTSNTSAPQRNLQTTNLCQSQNVADVAGLPIGLQNKGDGYFFSDNSNSLGHQMTMNNGYGWNENFTIGSNGDGSYYIKSLQQNNYINMGNNNWVNQQTYVGANEKWTFTDSGDGDGTWCIYNNQIQEYLNDYQHQLYGWTHCDGGQEKWAICLGDQVDHIQIDTWHLDTATQTPQAPVTIYSGCIDNSNSSIAESITYAFNAQTSTQSSFSETKGLKLGAKLTVEAKIPLLADEGLEISTEYSQQWTWGGSDTVTQGYTATLPIIAPPHAVYYGVAQVQSEQLNIPYNGTVYYQNTALTTQVSGIWTGVEHKDMQLTITDVTATGCPKK